MKKVKRKSYKRMYRAKNTRKKNTRKKNTRKKNTRKKNTRKKNTRKNTRKLKGGYHVGEGTAGRLLDDIINKGKEGNSKYSSEAAYASGIGANSTVYTVSSNNTPYALKLTDMMDSTKGRYNWTVLLDLLKEICILNGMKYSDYFIHLHDIVYHESYFCQVLDLGDALDTFITKGNPTKIDKIDIVKGLCAGLAHIHSIYLIHGDIKPQNVIVIKTPDGVCIPKLIDFGSTELFGRGTTFRGTYEYASPEYFDGVVLRQTVFTPTSSTDIWALGMCVVFISSGKYALDRRYGNPTLFKDILVHIAQICETGEVPKDFTTSDTENIMYVLQLKRVAQEPFISLTTLNENKELHTVAKGCLKIDPIERLSAKGLLSSLSGGVTVEVDYNKLFKGNIESFRRNLETIQYTWVDAIREYRERQGVTDVELKTYLARHEVFYEWDINREITSIVTNRSLKGDISEDIINVSSKLQGCCRRF